MDCSLEDARKLLRQWSSRGSSPASLRLSFIGRGLKLSYLPGVITEQPSGSFVFVAGDSSIEFDIGINTKARLISLDSPEAIPNDLAEFASQQGESMLVLEGALKDILIILKIKERISVSKVTPGGPQAWME